MRAVVRVSPRVVIEQLYSFELAIKALRKTETREARGKLVVSLEES
ncbi:MAG: hypothetical protein RR439_02375 [Carnobacterium sp.]|nr:hypothetical protein [Carnobacterium sp.]